MYKGPNFSTSFFFFFHYSHPGGFEVVDLIQIYLTKNETEGLACVYWLPVYLPLRNGYSDLLPILKLIQ
jgi:hypothetical protein